MNAPSILEGDATQAARQPTHPYREGEPLQAETTDPAARTGDVSQRPLSALASSPDPNRPMLTPRQAQLQSSTPESVPPHQMQESDAGIELDRLESGCGKRCWSRCQGGLFCFLTRVRCNVYNRHNGDGYQYKDKVHRKPGRTVPVRCRPRIFPSQV